MHTQRFGCHFARTVQPSAVRSSHSDCNTSCSPYDTLHPPHHHHPFTHTHTRYNTPHSLSHSLSLKHTPTYTSTFSLSLTQRLMMAVRKAPQECAPGFTCMVYRLAVLVQLLMGDIPERRYKI